MRIILGGPYPYKEQKLSGGVESVIKNLNLGLSLFEPQISFKILSGSYKAKTMYEIYNNIIYIKQPKFFLGSVYVSSYPSRIKNFLKKMNVILLMHIQ